MLKLYSCVNQSQDQSVDLQVALGLSPSQTKSDHDFLLPVMFDCWVWAMLGLRAAKDCVASSGTVKSI